MGQFTQEHTGRRRPGGKAGVAPLDEQGLPRQQAMHDSVLHGGSPCMLTSRRAEQLDAQVEAVAVGRDLLLSHAAVAELRWHQHHALAARPHAYHSLAQPQRRLGAAASEQPAGVLHLPARGWKGRPVRGMQAGRARRYVCWPEEQRQQQQSVDSRAAAAERKESGCAPTSAHRAYEPSPDSGSPATNSKGCRTTRGGGGPEPKREASSESSVGPVLTRQAWQLQGSEGDAQHGFVAATCRGQTDLEVSSQLRGAPLHTHLCDRAVAAQRARRARGDHAQPPVLDIKVDLNTGNRERVCVGNGASKIGRCEARKHPCARGTSAAGGG